MTTQASPPLAGRSGGRLAPGRSLLERRNPFVKFVAVSLVSIALLFVFDPVTPALTYLLTLVGVAATGRLRARTLLVGHVPFLAFAASLFMVNAVTRGGMVVARLGPLDVTDEGLSVGGSLAIRTLVIGVCVIGFVRSTDPARLLASLRQQARLPPRVAYSLLAAYRLLDDLPGRWTTIRRAHAVRDPARRPGVLPRSPRALARAAFTLLVTSLREAERLARTLELRGLGTGPRTTWRPTPLDRGDAVFLVTVIAGTAMVFLATWYGGWLRSFGALTS